MKSYSWRNSHVMVLLCLLALALSGCQALDFTPPAPTPTLVPATATPRPPQPTATPRPTATPLPSPTPPPALASSGRSPVIPAAQADLAKLATAPRYSISLTIDPAALTYTGRQTVAYTNTDTTPLPDLVFRIFPNACALYGCGALTVSAVRVGEQTVQPALEVDGTALRVPLPTPLASGQRVEVSLDFDGRVPRDFGPDKQGYGIYNYDDNAQTLMLANAYPILAPREGGRWVADAVYPDGDAVFSASAFYDVSVTLPGGWSPVGSGVAVSDGGVDGQRTVRYTSGPTRDFMLALGPNWNKVSRTVGETTVNSYYIGDTRAGGEKALDVAAQALETFNRRFGPYPFTELDVVPAPLWRAAGVEYPGVILVEDDYYSKPGEPFFEDATAHEVAHQWWYSAVGNDVINHPWLDEAFAQFSTALYYQDRYGQARYDRVIRQWQRIVDDLVAKGSDDIVGEGLPHFNGSDRYAPTIYIKGPLFFDAVRQRLGDEKFFAAVQQYYRQYKYGIAQPDDLKAVFETVGGQSIDDLWQKWILKAEGR